jgi:hypothetical protein
VQISLTIALVVAGGLVAYGFSRADVDPVQKSPPEVESPADSQVPADTLAGADLALPPVPPTTTAAP